MDADTRMRDGITFAILMGQYAVIVALFWGLSLEYQSNQFMRDWIAQNVWPVGYLLNGYFAALLLGILAGWMVVYVRRMMRKASPARTRA